MIQDAGYATKVVSPMQSIKAPEYHHERDPQYHEYSREHGLPSECARFGSRQFFSPSSPTYHLGQDYPLTDGMTGAFVRSSHEIYDGWTPRGSAELSTDAEEMETSPVYESGVDELSSGWMPSPRSPSDLTQTERRENQPQDYFSLRQDTTNTVVSQPISGDTVVAPRRSIAVGPPTSLEGVVVSRSTTNRPVVLPSPSPVCSRRHSSDTPSGRVVKFPSRSLRTSEESYQRGHERRPSRGEIQKRTRRARESSGPVIHPYVSYFAFRPFRFNFFNAS